MNHRMMKALAVIFLGAGVVGAEAPVPLAAEQVERLHRLIKPNPGESRWMEVDWHPSVWEGRQRAAREGKPLFIWAGSGGAPAAGC